MSHHQIRRAGLPLLCVSLLSSLNAPEPAWNVTGALNSARFIPSTTVLTDGRVLVAGGQFGCTQTVPCIDLAAAEI